jgi:hypothetical protein
MQIPAPIVEEIVEKDALTFLKSNVRSIMISLLLIFIFITVLARNDERV